MCWYREGSVVKIKYNKEKPGRILMGRGPRDLQLRRKALQEQKIYNQLTPTMSAESTDKRVQQGIDLSQYLSLEEVRKKIEEAVNTVREDERRRYESGLRNLNEQLNVIRKKAVLAEEKLMNANKEIDYLKNTVKLLEGNLIEKDKQLSGREKEVLELKKEIDVLKVELRDKNNEIIKLRTSTVDSKSTELINELQNKLDRLYEKIPDGSISPLIGSETSKPELEDKVFIDPLDSSIKEKEASLDTYIDIKTEHKEVKRSVEEDVSKLKKLLKK